MDQLTRDCIAARKAGMTYGKWKALQPVVVPVAEVEPEPEDTLTERTCRNCGTKLPISVHPLARYCSQGCKHESNKRMSLAYYYRKKGRMADGKV